MPEARTLVFGATGSLGRHVLNELVVRGAAPGTFTAVGRNASRLAELAEAGFGTIALDPSDAAGAVDLVCHHCDTRPGSRSDIVLVSGSDADRLSQHLSVIEAAKNAGARHVYYTSGVRADDDQSEIDSAGWTGLASTSSDSGWHGIARCRPVVSSSPTGGAAAADAKGHLATR